MPSPCEAFDESLPDLLDGILPERTRAAADAHAARCPRCREKKASLAALRTTLEESHAAPPLGAGFTRDVMNRIRRAAPAPVARRGTGRAVVFTAAAAVFVIAAAIAFRFLAGGAGADIRLRSTAGATLVVGAESVRVGAPGDVLRLGESLITLGGDRASVDLGGDRTVELSPLSALRLDSGDDVSLRIGAAFVSALDPAANPVRVRVGGAESVMISGAEGAIRADGARLSFPGDAFYLWHVSSPLADLAIRDTIARVEIATLTGELRIAEAPGSVALRREDAAAAPSHSEPAVVLPAGRTYRRRTGPPAPDDFPDPGFVSSDSARGAVRLVAERAPLADALAGAKDARGILAALERALDASGSLADAAASLALVAPSEAPAALARALERLPAGSSGTPDEGLARIAFADALAKLEGGSEALRRERDRAIAALGSEAPEPSPRPSAAAPAELASTALAAASLLRALEGEGPASDAAIVAVASPASEAGAGAEAPSRLRRYVVRAEIRSAAFLRDSEFVSWLGSILGDEGEDAALRAEAALALGRIGSPSGTAYLLRAAGDETAPAEVRSGALFALAAYRDPAATPALVRVLASAGPLADRRLAAVALRQYPGDAESAAALAAAAGDPASDETLAAEALHAASERREASSVAVIAKALADPRDRVSEAAVAAAATHPDPAYVAALETRFAIASDPAARRAAVRALGAIGGTAAEPAVRRAMSDADRSVRLEAVAAAAFVSSPALEAELARILREAEAEGDGALTETAIAALSERAGRSADPDALVEALRPFLEKTGPADRAARRAAAQAVARTASERAAEALAPLLRGDDAELAAIAAAERMSAGDLGTFESYRAVAAESADARLRAHALLAIADGVRREGPLAAEALRFATDRLQAPFAEPLDAFLALLLFDRLAPEDSLEPAVRSSIEPLTGSADPWLATAALAAIAARSDEPRLRAAIAGESTPWTPEARLRDGAANGLATEADLVAECRRAFAERPIFSDAANASGSRHDLRGGVDGGDLAALRASLDRFFRRNGLLESALLDRLIAAPAPEARAGAARWLSRFSASGRVERELRRAAAQDESAEVRAAAEEALRSLAAAAAGRRAIERLSERITNLLDVSMNK